MEYSPFNVNGAKQIAFFSGPYTNPSSIIAPTGSYAIKVEAFGFDSPEGYAIFLTGESLKANRDRLVTEGGMITEDKLSQYENASDAMSVTELGIFIEVNARH